jgi:hypothetical protein
MRPDESRKLIATVLEPALAFTATRPHLDRRINGCGHGGARARDKKPPRERAARDQAPL